MIINSIRHSGMPASSTYPIRINYRSFSFSILSRSEQNSTTSRTDSSFKVFMKEFGRQLVINTPVFVAYGLVLVLFEEKEEKSEPPPKG